MYFLTLNLSIMTPGRPTVLLIKKFNKLIRINFILTAKQIASISLLLEPNSFRELSDINVSIFITSLTEEQNLPKMYIDMNG